MAKTKKQKVEKKKKASKILHPRIEIVGSVDDPKKGLKIEMNWNPDFTFYLRNNGYSGPSDDVIVQKWLAILYAQLIEDINPEKKSDFE